MRMLCGPEAAGERANVFAGVPHALYLPVSARYTLMPETAFVRRAAVSGGYIARS